MKGAALRAPLPSYATMIPEKEVVFGGRGAKLRSFPQPLLPSQVYSVDLESVGVEEASGALLRPQHFLNLHWNYLVKQPGGRKGREKSELRSALFSLPFLPDGWLFHN